MSRELRAWKTCHADYCTRFLRDTVCRGLFQLLGHCSAGDDLVGITKGGGLGTIVAKKQLNARELILVPYSREVRFEEPPPTKTFMSATARLKDFGDLPLYIVKEHCEDDTRVPFWDVARLPQKDNKKCNLEICHWSLKIPATITITGEQVWTATANKAATVTLRLPVLRNIRAVAAGDDLATLADP